MLLSPETFQSETTPPTVLIADMFLLELAHTNLDITISEHVFASVNCARIPRVSDIWTRQKEKHIRVS
jgi:hypothetical protein